MTTLKNQELYEYPVTPILEPDEIKDPKTKEIATALINYSQKPVPTTITEYTLPSRPKIKDPRNMLQRAIDSIKLTVLLGEDSTSRLAKRIQDAQTYARAEIEYAWLEQSKAKVDQALQTLHRSYAEVGEYLINIKTGLDKAKRRIRDCEGKIKQGNEEIKNLENDLKSEALKEEIKQLLGEEAVKQAADGIEDEIKNQKRSIVQTIRESEYVDKLTRQYIGIADACEATLEEIEPAMHRAQEQKLDLERTLHIYKGLTEKQISAARAAQFLLDVQTLTQDLKEGMKEIDKKHTKKLSEYNTNAPPQKLLLEPREKKQALGTLKLPDHRTQ